MKTESLIFCLLFLIQMIACESLFFSCATPRCNWKYLCWNWEWDDDEDDDIVLSMLVLLICIKIIVFDRDWTTFYLGVLIFRVCYLILRTHFSHFRSKINTCFNIIFSWTHFVHGRSHNQKHIFANLSWHHTILIINNLSKNTQNTGRNSASFCLH